MARKILAGVVIGLSALLLLASAAGIGAVWGYNTPLTEAALARLAQVDAELSLAQVSLERAHSELERTLRLVDAADAALTNLKEELALARQLFDEVDDVLDGSLIPSLQGARAQVENARKAIADLRGSLEALNALPFVNLNLPGDALLTSLLGVTNTIDGQIARIEDLAAKAAAFADDAAYLMGGDLTETRQNLQDLLNVVTDYQSRVTGWRAQIAGWSAALPGWLDAASAGLTVFLLWFGLGNFSLLLHALEAWRGGDPLAVLRRGK